MMILAIVIPVAVLIINSAYYEYRVFKPEIDPDIYKAYLKLQFLKRYK